MENYEPVMSFGDEAAASYEDWLRGDEEVAVAFLEQLADGGPVLELAICSGRIALPSTFRDALMLLSIFSSTNQSASQDDSASGQRASRMRGGSRNGSIGRCPDSAQQLSTGPGFQSPTSRSLTSPG